MGNPVRLVDPDGRAPDDVIVRNKSDRASILKMINSRAAGVFKFDDNGKLYQHESGSPETGSTYYAERLVSAINDSDVIEISISETAMDPSGDVKNVDDDAGGGMTLLGASKTTKAARVTISGNGNTSLKNTEGYPLPDTPADILGHELLGHAIPWTVKPDTGNAVDNENKSREEQPSFLNAQRKKDPAHVEFPKQD
jgi:hypothetical protein